MCINVSRGPLFVMCTVQPTDGVPVVCAYVVLSVSVCVCVCARACVRSCALSFVCLFVCFGVRIRVRTPVLVVCGRVSVIVVHVCACTSCVRVRVYIHAGVRTCIHKVLQDFSPSLVPLRLLPASSPFPALLSPVALTCPNSLSCSLCYFAHFPTSTRAGAKVLKQVYFIFIFIIFPPVRALVQKCLNRFEYTHTIPFAELLLLGLMMAKPHSNFVYCARARCAQMLISLPPKKIPNIMLMHRFISLDADVCSTCTHHTHAHT